VKRKMSGLPVRRKANRPPPLVDIAIPFGEVPTLADVVLDSGSPHAYPTQAAGRACRRGRRLVADRVGPHLVDARKTRRSTTAALNERGCNRAPIDPVAE